LLKAKQNLESEKKGLTEIKFSELISYASESYGEQVGEEFIIKNVPAAKNQLRDKRILEKAVILC